MMLEFFVILAAIPLGLYVCFALVYFIDARGEPRITYRAFRSIEAMAPERWDGEFDTPRYRTNDGFLESVYMKTVFDAIRCYLGYILPYRRAERDRSANARMSKMVKCWSRDIQSYQLNAQEEINKIKGEMN